MLQLLLISLLQQNSGTQIDASESEEQEEKDDRVSDDEEQKGEEYEGNQYGSFVGFEPSWEPLRTIGTSTPNT
jgi:hypothetical protein